MAKRKTKKKIGARAGAKMHKAAGRALGAHARGVGMARMHAAAGKAIGQHHAKKKAKKKGKKRRGKKKGGKKKSYTTKMQIGRSKVRAKCPEGTTLIGAVVASKDRAGKKHTSGVARCVKGRFVR